MMKETEGSESVATAIVGSIACPGCDILVEDAECGFGESLSCPRCGQLLKRPRKDGAIRTCAFSLTGLFLFIPANVLPLLTFDVFGISRQASIVDCIVVLFRQHYYLVSALVALTSLVIPFLKFSLLFVLSWQLATGIRLVRHPARLMGWYQHLHEWGMVEIFLIGILVTVVKMYPMAIIEYPVGFFTYLGMTGAGVWVSQVFDGRWFWERIGQMPGNGTGGIAVERLSREMSTRHVVARDAGLVNCGTCHFLFRPADPIFGHWPCPRCSHKTHFRIPDSVNKTRAFLISAVFFAFPANLLPVMEVKQFGALERSTIMDGIIHFFRHGSYGIGFIIFTASVLVPLFKIIGMLIILNSIYFSRLTRLKPKTVMFRLIAFIGRWSMLDIFVIALLCAVVDFGLFTSIAVAPAAPYFAAVVVATMGAAGSFDIRLLWDPVHGEDGAA